MSVNSENIEEKLANMQALKARIEGPKTRSKVEQGELVQAMFLTMCEFFPVLHDHMNQIRDYAQSVQTLTEELREVKDDVEDLKHDMANMKAELTTVINDMQTENTYIKKQIVQNEIEKSQTAVIVRNFEPTNSAGKVGEDAETASDLRQGLNNFLTFLQINERIKVKDVFRLKSNDKKGKSLFSPVKVTFFSKNDRAIFFSNVKLLKNSPYHLVNLCQDVPRCLSTQFTEIDTKGYRLRTANPGLKVKVVLYKMQYSLMVKGEGDRMFTPYNEH